MSITIQQERFADVIEEVRPLAARDWEEMIPYKEACGLDLDEAAYRKIEDAGLMRGWTVRRDGRLIGYIVYAISPGGLHSKQSKRAYNLDWWLAPEERNGRMGITMLQHAERALRDEATIMMGTTVMGDSDAAAAVLEYLGHERTGMIYTKVLNGEDHA